MKSVFEDIDRPALRSLPVSRYEYARFLKVTAGRDYHVSVDEHDYSVPYKYAGERMEVRIDRNCVEILLDDERIASH